jgi:hypothetical protein
MGDSSASCVRVSFVELYRLLGPRGEDCRGLKPRGWITCSGTNQQVGDVGGAGIFGTAFHVVAVGPVVRNGYH